MKHDISVSKEYIDSLCEWLEEWRERKSSWVIPQFMQEFGIGWSYLKALIEVCPQLQHVFEVTTAALAEKWMLFAFENDDLPPHVQKILHRYLRIYDSHASFVELEEKKEVAERTKFAITNYAIEDYSKERLEGLYKRLFEENARKRRSRKKT